MTDRPEIRVRITLRNHRLVSAREDLGLSQIAMARAAGVSNSTLNGLETLRDTARGTDGIEWRPVALTVAAYLGISPAEILDHIAACTARPNPSRSCTLTLPSSGSATKPPVTAR